MSLFIQKEPLTKVQLVGLLVLSVLLYVTKMNNVILLLLIPFLPFALYRHLPPIKLLIERFSKRQLLIGFSILVGAIGAFSLFVLIGRLGDLADIPPLHTLKVLFSTLMSTDMPSVPPVFRDPAQIDAITVTGIFGTFGWVEYRLPEWAVCIGFSVLLVLFLNDGEFVAVPKRFAVASLVVFVLCVASVFLGAYYIWTDKSSLIIDGVQGRYLTPFLFLLVPSFMYLQNHIRITVRKNPRLIGMLTAGSSVFLLCLSVVLTICNYWFTDVLLII
jgi:uncharacterized membrane protein